MYQRTANNPMMPSIHGASHRRSPPEIPHLDQALFDAYCFGGVSKKRRGDCVDNPEKKKLKIRLEPRLRFAPPNRDSDAMLEEMVALELSPPYHHRPRNESSFSTPVGDGHLLRTPKTSNVPTILPHVPAFEDLDTPHLTLKPRGRSIFDRLSVERSEQAGEEEWPSSMDGVVMPRTLFMPPFYTPRKP